MKTNKSIIRIIAVAALCAMLLSFGGCIKTYNDDPTIIKCGKEKIGLQKYLNVFQSSDYYQYYQQGYLDASTYSDYVVNELVSYGVQLNQAKEQGITLTEEEEADVMTKVDDAVTKYLADNYNSKIDSSITDDAAKRAAAMELFEKDLKDNGSSMKKYRADLEESYRNSALINKLRDSVVGDITVNNDDVQKYFDDNLNTSTTVANFNSAFKNFIGGTASAIPAYMPVLTEAEPAEGDAESGEAAEDANKMTEYDQLFSVFHVLLKFDEEAGKDVTDLGEYAESQPKEFITKRTTLEDKLSTLDLQGFLDELCFNEETNEDPGMANEAYRYFGYLMSEQLIDGYYEGWGNAAMMLKYPDWEPEKEDETTDDTSSDDSAEETPEVDHGYTPMTLADGTQVMRVYTTSGIHYIILNPNDWSCMYGEDGKLRAPIYDGDDVKKDGDSIVTTAGNITQEVFDAMEEAFSHIGDKDSEDFVATTCKSIYDVFNSGALSKAQNDVYTAKFNEWKEATKIKIRERIIKTLATGY